MEVAIGEMAAIDRDATGFLAQVVMPLITLEYEAQSAVDARTAKQLKRRINLKINTWKESDEHVCDLKADVEALRERLG